MKKILLLLILIYTSCNGPSSSNPDLSEAIIGNWYEWQYIYKWYENGIWYSDTAEMNDTNTDAVLVFGTSILEYYSRSYPSGYVVKDYTYSIEGDKIVMVDDSGDVWIQNISCNNSVLVLEEIGSNWLDICKFKKYSGAVPPPWNIK